MRADFQPGIHAELRERSDRGSKLHRLPHAARPVRGIARFPCEPPTADGAKKRYGFGFRRQIRQRRLECVGGGLHHRMMKGKTHLQEPRKNA